MRAALKSAPPLAQLAVLVLIGILATVFFSGILSAILLAGGMDPAMLVNMQGASDPDGLQVLLMKWMQLIQASALFILPYLMFRYVMQDRTYSVVPRTPRWTWLLLFMFIIPVSMPMVNYLAAWNSGLQLPEFMAGIQDWIVHTERTAEKIIEVFLKMDGPMDLMYNLLLIALVPAIGEELFFRGTLQPLMLKMIRNKHLAIWTTAFIFSFFHMQFLGFVPRMLLGGVFGYAAHWSGTLLLPIIGHLMNNGIAVILTYYIGTGAIAEQVETVGANEGDRIMGGFSALVLAAGMWALWKLTAARRLSTQA